MSTLNSNSINIQPAQSTTDLASFKTAYLKSLTAPLDGYWETAVIGLAPHYEIWGNNHPIGYCVITEDQQLLQIYTIEGSVTFTALKQLITTGKAKTAVVGTNDPSILANCAKLIDNFEMTINTYLFQDDIMPAQFLPPANAEFRLATMQDLKVLVNFYNQNDEYEDSDAIEAGFDSHHHYTKSLIENEQVFLLTDEKTIFGIGECRFSQSQPPFADVGMIVNKSHRRQHLGTTILVQLKKFCYKNGRKPICSCDAENIASRKTIEKAGFRNTDRLLNIKF